ncbi:MAG TPA: hypothetical protein ENG70_05245 [Candidatus Cloacimonetes bacterium]|nr:hypothetical protein [Candidatus Cloacimonadota bacterium]HEX38244.1 hypothetical protein [Candidatus Cloacimonadota bacterium]
MRKILLTTLLIFNVIRVFAGENPVPQSVEMPDSTTIKRPKNCFLLSFDTIVLPGINLGYGWIIYDSTYASEEIVTVHYNTIGDATALGIYLQKTKFRNVDRTGWFCFWKLGLDYSRIHVFYIAADPGGASSPSKNRQTIFPLISAGLGYSWKIGKNSFFRITGDIGVKAVLASLSFSVVF